MKNKVLWICLAVLVVAAIVLAIVLPRTAGQAQNEEPAAVQETQPGDADPAPETEASPEPTPVDPELPLDDSPLAPTTEPDGDEAGGDIDPVDGGEIDPAEGEEQPVPTDSGLDEDELPIIP